LKSDKPLIMTTFSNCKHMYIFFSMSRQPYMGLGLLVSSRFHGHTQLRHTTVGRTPLDEWSARRTDLYLTTHNTHKRQTSMPYAGFEPTIPVSKRPKTHALDRAATGIGRRHLLSGISLGTFDTWRWRNKFHPKRRESPLTQRHSFMFKLIYSHVCT
jgi:hypothetical protein